MKTNIKHEFKVSLVEVDRVLVVDVDHHKDGHRVDPQEKQQFMVWRLAEGTNGCSFVPMDEEKPGFEWMPRKPKAGIFGTPQICPTCGDLTITNTHKKNGDAKGDYTYKLRVRTASGTYETLNTSGNPEPPPVDDGAGQTPEDPCARKKRVTTNPRIKNT